MHSPASPSPPTPRQIDDALAVVHSPALVHDQPALRAIAWDTLKRQRGQRMNLDRIGALQDSQRRAHLNVIANEACRQAAHTLTARPSFARYTSPAAPEAPFWDDVDPSQFDASPGLSPWGPDLNGAA